MGGEKKAYGTYGEGGTGTGEIIWNVNKEYRKNMLEVLRLSWNPYQYEGRCHDLYLCCFCCCCWKESTILTCPYKRNTLQLFYLQTHAH